MKVLIYAGTTEGRLLAERLADAHVACDVHVATEYGQMVMPKLQGVQVYVGRLDKQAMRELVCNRGYAAVVDATHPYATEVSENIRASLQGLAIPYLRLLRGSQSAEPSQDVRYFADYESCADALRQTSGNILLTTGSKELHRFCQKETLRERMYVRVLPGRESIRLCEEAGICGKQILAMQGSFSEEMNLAMIHQFSIRYLVTKESGAHSGFQEKIKAAHQAGITACIIGRQKKEEGLSFEEAAETLSGILGVTVTSCPKVKINLIGIGMGKATLTQQAQEALESADLIFGAERMLEVAPEGREMYPFYLAEDILPILRQREKTSGGGELNIAILFSGDTGFYSGTEKMKTQLKKNGYSDICIFPGISSVSYLAAATGVSWQDAHILSIHGMSDRRKAQALVTDAARCHAKTFLLVSGAEDVRNISIWLGKLNLPGLQMTVGYRLSYPEETISCVSWEEAARTEKEGLYTILLQNATPIEQRVVPGVADTAFLRVQDGTQKTVPMTKEEIRELSLCKLGLTEDAVVYDVGSGTGSIAIECALRSPKIHVYAIEQKPQAQQLLRENMEKFQLANIIPVDGKAPDAMEALEPPTHVFIGGSGGELEEILACIRRKNPAAKIVITAVSLETVAKLTELTERQNAEIIQVQVSRAGKIGDYHLMRAENPVYICTLTMQ